MFGDAALAYSEMGWSVFPLVPRGKVPAVHNGVKDATTDPEQIVAWWTRNPDCNVAIATGSHSGGLIVVDMDEHSDTGVSGYESMREWMRDNVAISTTVISTTGGGGHHMLLHASRPIGNRVNVLPSVDIRGENGYIVAPPSIHASGRTYEWEISPFDTRIQEAPPELLDLITGPKSTTRSGTPEFTIDGVVAEGKRNDTMFRLACSLQGKGLTDTAILAAVQAENKSKCKPPLSDSELSNIVSSALSHHKGMSSKMEQKIESAGGTAYIQLAKSKDGKILQTIGNCCTVIREDPALSGKVALNALSYLPQATGKMPWQKQMVNREWRDVDSFGMLCYMQEKYGLMSEKNVNAAVALVAEENRYNPVVQWLEGLPEWDKDETAISRLLPEYVGVLPTEYSMTVMHMFMHAAIERAYNPGAKFDNVPVLIGPQGCGKSMFVRRLAVNDDWFDDNMSTLEGKTAAEKLRGRWIIEIAELLAMKRAKDVEAVKAFITSQSDIYRPSYAHNTEVHQRACVFMGTTNSPLFITDATGGRRFLPLETMQVRPSKSLFDKDWKDVFSNAWAEALYEWRNGEKILYVPESLQKYAEEQQEAHTEEDARIGLIANWLDHTTEQYVCAQEIIEDVLQVNRSLVTRKLTTEVHGIMRNMDGWTVYPEAGGKHRTSRFGLQRCYVRKKQTSMNL